LAALAVAHDSATSVVSDIVYSGNGARYRRRRKIQERVGYGYRRGRFMFSRPRPGRS